MGGNNGAVGGGRKFGSCGPGGAGGSGRGFNAEGAERRNGNAERYLENVENRAFLRVLWRELRGPPKGGTTMRFRWATRPHAFFDGSGTRPGRVWDASRTGVGRLNGRVADGSNALDCRSSDG
jgi:hypothetical protein